jgi:hypothetical protein
MLSERASSGGGGAVKEIFFLRGMANSILRKAAVNITNNRLWIFRKKERASPQDFRKIL